MKFNLNKVLDEIENSYLPTDKFSVKFNDEVSDVTHIKLCEAILLAKRVGKLYD